MSGPQSFRSIRPSRRPLVLAALAVLATSAVRADDLPDDQMSPFQFSAVINADNVYLRAGPGESTTEYPVVKLSNGTPVTIVGNHGDWLKVLPTEGVYCMVGKPWVDRRGDSSVGRVTPDATNATVRVASNLSTDYGRIATTLKPGQDVKVLGEREEYYKIAPPPGVFLFVNKRFVQPVKRVEVVEDAGQLVVKGAEGDAKPEVAKIDTPAQSDQAGGGPKLVDMPSTQPNGTAVAANTANTAVGTTSTATPSTQPAGSVKDAFNAAEAQFIDASKKPLGEQPLDEMTAAYTQIKSDPSADDTMKKVADFRLNVLSLRKDAAATLASTDAARKQRDAQQQSMAAEAKEMSDKLAANQVRTYTAVGTLRPSSLPYGGRTLYRLTDPANGRTLVYVATTDPKVTAMDGSFIGVRGTITEDTVRQIKLLTPDSAEALDPTDLANGSVTSGMVPASLQVAAASVGR